MRNLITLLQIKSSALKQTLQGLSKWQVLALVIPLIGLVVGVILVQRQQLLRSQASQEVINAFSITDEDYNPLSCADGVCETKGLRVRLRLQDLVPLESLHD